MNHPYNHFNPTTMSNKLFAASLLLAGGMAIGSPLFAQESYGKVNIINTAVPFMAIPVHPSLNGLITVLPDGTNGPGIFGNNALAGIDTARMGFAADFIPNPVGIAHDMFLTGAGGFWRITSKHTVGFNLRYFSWSTFTYTDTLGNQYTNKPREMAGTLFYTFSPNKWTGIGGGLKFIYSKLAAFTPSQPGWSTYHDGRSVALDIGFARQFNSSGDRIDHFIGAAVDNIGSKVSFSKYSDGQFIPTTLLAGYAFRFHLNGSQWLQASYELSKLLVPTPPEYYPDSVDLNQDPVIRLGYDPNVGVFRGMIQSFYDAPGGFTEEIREIKHSFGIVYHLKSLSAGVGYQREDPTKGNRSYLTAGLTGGIRLGKGARSPRLDLQLSGRFPVQGSNNNGKSVQTGISLAF
jgi:hypothetical protein